MGTVVIVAGVAALVLMLLGYVYETRYRSPIARLRRIRTPAAKEMSPEEVALQQPILLRIVGPFAQRMIEAIARVSPQGIKDGVRKRLRAAGNPWRAQSEEVILAKMIIAAAGGLLGGSAAFLLMGAGLRGVLMYGLFGLALGFLVPDMLISSAAGRRKKLIQRQLPYMLDLLSVSVEAGLGFDAAMQKVAEKVEGPLSDEFRQVAYEVRIGKPRRDALRDMRDRCGVSDLNTFVAAIIQAERLGLGIGHVLRVQAEQLRTTRRERVREAAMKVPIKMLFPLVFLVLPALFVVILGPAVLQLIDTFSGTEGGF